MKSPKTETFNRHNYFPLHVATFVLVLLSLLAAKRIIPDSALILLITGSATGFCISWYVADNKEAQRWITVVVNIFGLTIVIWLIGVLLHTEFLYVSINKVLFKALLAIELVLSFMLFSSKSYNYIQIISVFLVLSSIAIKMGLGYQQPAIVILYIFTYVIMMRLKFLIEIKRDIKSFIGAKVRNRNIYNLISVVILLSVLFGLSWILFIRVSKVKPYPYGILPSKIVGPTTEEENLVGQAASSIEIQQDAAQRFFDSKRRLNRELNKLVDKKQTTTYQKKRLLYFLLELLKEDIPIQKVQEEILKLKEFLRSPDLDLFQTERARLSSLADEYMRHRTEYESEQLNKTLKEKLSATNLNMGRRLAILWLFRRLQNTSQLSLACRIVEKAHKKIEEEQLLMLAQKEDLKDVFNGLLSVKTNQTTMHIMGSLKDLIKEMSGLNEKERTRLNEILSNIETDQDISLLKAHFKEMKSQAKKFKMQGKISQDENNKMSSALETLRQAKTLQIASNVTFHIVRKIDSSCQKADAKKLKDELRKMKQAESAEEFQKSFSKMKDTLEQSREQGAITAAGSNYIENQLEELFQAKAEELAQRLEKEFATALEKETRVTASQKGHLKDELSRLKEAGTEHEAQQGLKEITEQLNQLSKEDRMDYASSQMLKQKAEEIFDTKSRKEAKPDTFRPEKILPPYSAKDAFSTFRDEVKKLNISSGSEQNLEILSKQLQESSSTIQVQETLKDILTQIENLLQEKEISPLEYKTLKEKVDILAKIRQRIISASLASPLKKEIEGLENIGREQKAELKEDVEQMLSKGDFEDLDEKYDKVMAKINELRLQEQVGIEIEKREGEKGEEIKQDWEIEIIPSTILCYVGTPFQLRVIGIYKNTIIHDLTKEVIWESENEDIVYIKEGLLIPFVAGKAKIKAVWLGSISSKAECTIIQKIPEQEVQWLNSTVSKRRR